MEPRVSSGPLGLLIALLLSLGACSFSGRFEPPAMSPSSIVSLPFPWSILAGRRDACAPLRTPRCDEPQSDCDPSVVDSCCPLSSRGDEH
ncbi:MAG: hypothetical protein U0165_14005 [Polyangiaceae bacterium]